jgi:Bacterial Ig-like domain
MLMVPVSRNRALLASAAAFDPLAPGAPFLDLVAVSDTGASSTDNITADTTPDLDVIYAGSAIAGDIVEIRDNGVIIVTHTLTAPEAAAAAWTSGATTLGAGAHSLQARHSRAGHSSPWSTELSVAIDTTAPSITSASSTSIAENQQLAFTVTTNEAATIAIGGADAAQFELASNPLGTSRVLRWAGNGTRDFETPADAGANNVYDITLTPTDAAGNAGTAQNFAVTVTNVVDETAPTISGALTFASGAGADNTYIAGDNIDINVPWSETVLVTGAPRLTIDVGGVNKTANYLSGHNSANLVFRYSVQSGDTDANGVSIAANSLALNGGTIRDATGNNATLTHGAVTDNASHKVDTTTPTVSSFNPLDNATGVAVTTSPTVTFSENVAFGTGAIELYDSDNDLIESFDVVTEQGAGNGQVSISGAVLTINPTASMEASKGHYIKIAATAIKDLAGNVYAGIADTTTWNFTTGAGASAEYDAFIARTSGLDATHLAAYQGLIDGLVADGVWSKFDVLYVFATQDSTTALLNLISSSFNATANGAPTFTTDRGYTGVDSSSTVFLDTGFNPVTASSPKFTQNNGHVSTWNNTNVLAGSAGGRTVGLGDVGLTTRTLINPRYSDNNAYFRLNSSTATAGVANTDSRGHYVATRDSSTTLKGYISKVDQSAPSDTSAAPFNGTFHVLGSRLGTAGSFGAGIQVASASIGSHLSATDVTNFHDRLRTYLTAVGVP